MPKLEEHDHFIVLLHLLEECLLCHRWKEAGKILSSLCMYPAPDADQRKGLPGRELIWKCGIEMLYHHPNTAYEDIKQFHSKRGQLDGKTSGYKSLLEHTFYLLSEQKVKEAYGLIKQKTLYVKKNAQVYTPNAKQAKYEKGTLLSMWKDLVTAYTGIIAYMMWYRTGTENSTSTTKDVEKYWETAVSNLGLVADKPGVWDIFITKHIELLCSKDQTDEALKLARKYSDANPGNPNAHKYLYHLMKSQGVDRSSLIEVLKEIVQRLPSDELVLEYVDLLREENKHCHQTYLPPLFDMLDYACWKENIRPWQALAERLQSIHQKKSHHGAKVIRSCWKLRESWWGHYHFNGHLASQIARQDKLLAVEKAVVATYLLNPDCVFVSKVVRYLTRHKKRKCLKRLNRAKAAFDPTLEHM